MKIVSKTLFVAVNNLSSFSKYENKTKKSRKASHAGTWYASNSNELSNQLDSWLSKSKLYHGPARAIIAPHAAYDYCGTCLAFAYKQIDPSTVKRFFILGPAHNVKLHTCAISTYENYETPFYSLAIDKEISADLEATKLFKRMDIQTDEQEHSIEMQLPYIAKIMADKTFTIIPILVGSLTVEKQAQYGSILAPYLADPPNLVIISSDFCHWGEVFGFTWTDKSKGEIHQNIAWLDGLGMDIIEKLDAKAFTDYLNQYENTICGRHAIGILLHAIEIIRTRTNCLMSMRFLNYVQSSKCFDMKDSSVSYASATLVVK